MANGRFPSAAANQANQAGVDLFVFLIPPLVPFLNTFLGHQPEKNCNMP